MCPSDLERSHHGYSVLSQILDGIRFSGFIAIPDIAIVEGNGSIRAAKGRQLFVPALSFGAQPHQQHDRSPRAGWGYLLIGKPATIYHDDLGLMKLHHWGSFMSMRKAFYCSNSLTIRI